MMRSHVECAWKTTKEASKFAACRAIISAAENARNKCSKFQKIAQKRISSVQSAVMIALKLFGVFLDHKTN